MRHPLALLRAPRLRTQLVLPGVCAVVATAVLLGSLGAWQGARLSRDVQARVGTLQAQLLKDTGQQIDSTVAAPRSPPRPTCWR